MERRLIILTLATAVFVPVRGRPNVFFFPDEQSLHPGADTEPTAVDGGSVNRSDRNAGISDELPSAPGQNQHSGITDLLSEESNVALGVGDSSVNQDHESSGESEIIGVDDIHEKSAAAIDVFEGSPYIDTISSETLQDVVNDFSSAIESGSTKDQPLARSSSAHVFHWSDSGAGHHSSSVLFPGSSRNIATQSVPSCDGRTVSAVNPDTRLCQLLGSSSGCPPDQQFFFDPLTDEPRCRKLQCADGFLAYKGTCRMEDDRTFCPEGMALARDRYGGGTCDCRLGYALWPQDGRCYPALRQGPCPVGQVVSAPSDGYDQLCTPNVCMRDGILAWFGEGAIGCYPLDAPNSGCESEQLLVLNVESETLICNWLAMRAIFQLPNVRCPGEARLDYSGKCRQPLVQRFRTR